MIDNSELMEAALERFPEGLALLGRDGAVVFWNRAAENITGFPNIDVQARDMPWGLEPLLHRGSRDAADEVRPLIRPARYCLIHAQHRSGSALPLMTRSVILRDALGSRIGFAVIFHPAEHIDTLPHGEHSEESDLESAQDEMEEQAQSAYEDFVDRGAPLGLLWITVDQAHELRKTCGATAWETMIARIERTLAHGLRPAEEL